MGRIENDARAAAAAMLEVVREELGLDVAFISEIEGDQRRFRTLASGVDLPIDVGHSEDYEGTYCQLITSGRLGEVTPDTSAEPLVADAFHTDFLGIGSYVGVPLRRSDGGLFGTLCAFSRSAVPDLSAAHAEVLRATGSLVMRLVEAEEEADDRLRMLARPSDEPVARASGIDMVPVVEVRTGTVVGHDGTPRFEDGSGYRRRLAAARAVGRGVELELSVLAEVLATAESEQGEVGVVLSPEALGDPAFPALVASTQPRRLLLRFDVDDPVEDHERLAAILQPWRRLGLKVAVDRFGAGGAEVRHLLLLAPDVLRIDPALVRGVAHDRRRRDLVEAIGLLAERLDADAVALGVTSQEELDWLDDLGIAYAVREAAADRQQHADRPREVELGS